MPEHCKLICIKQLREVTQCNQDGCVVPLSHPGGGTTVCLTHKHEHCKYDIIIVTVGLLLSAFLK